jgi:hypothetical protein
MTFKEQVQRDAAIDATAFEFKTLAEAMKVTNGIVFVYARWSGTAIYSWRMLTAALAGLESLPRVLVVDADEVDPKSAAELLGELPQGKGETLWIKEGKAVAKLAAYREGDTTVLIDNSKRILN